MISEADYPERGWQVLPSFCGQAAALDEGVFGRMQAHPMLPGESAWGTRNLLHALILSMRPKVVLEVGAHIGSAAVVIGAALRANGFGRGFHLEPQDHYHEVLAAFISQAGLDGICVPLKIYSTDPGLRQAMEEPADIIFLDANHSYSHATEDLHVCDRLLAPQGLILLDDVGAPHSGSICREGKGGVRQALLDFLDERPDYSAIFFEPPFWLNPCGLALVARKPVR